MFFCFLGELTLLGFGYDSTPPCWIELKLEAQDLFVTLSSEALETVEIKGKAALNENVFW